MSKRTYFTLTDRNEILSGQFFFETRDEKVYG